MPFIYFGFRPDASAVALDDMLHNGQADTRALEFVSAMESLKDTEEFSSISRIEACTVVPHKIDILSPLLSATHFNPRLLPLAREFERIG